MITKMIHLVDDPGDIGEESVEYFRGLVREGRIRADADCVAVWRELTTLEDAIRPDGTPHPLTNPSDN
jgi:hypothetical protein